MKFSTNCEIKILVTGLCLQGNKGGPAIFLSLRKQLDNYFPSARYILSVPFNEFECEKSWIDRYDVEIVEQIDLLASLKSIKGMFFLPFRFIKWINCMRKSNFIVAMDAICYVGPPLWRNITSLFGNRFLSF